MAFQSSLYALSSAFGNGNGNGHARPGPHLITGRSIITHTNRDVDERAGLAARLVLGEAHLVKPTVPQAAALTHATIHTIYDALRLAPETRVRVAAGELSLTDAMKGNGLVSAWLVATPAEKAALGSIVGVDEVWDSAINPSI
jgi:hypothetical protein